MSFIGNDIIALNDSYNQKSFSKSKYIKKILTDEELQYCNVKQNSQYLPFFFWTCKESAYKIALKEGTDKGFVPQNYNVNPENVILGRNSICYSGTVSDEKNLYFFKSHIFPEYISTIACSDKNKLSSIKNFVGESSDQSHDSREMLMRNIARYFNIDVQSFKVGKTEKGIPFIHCTDNVPMPDISFSHDGNYFSYALLHNNIVI